MTDADLKQLLTAATKGPWGSFFEIGHYSVWSEDGRKVGTAIMGPDARLIALAPTLAQEVLALRAEVARLREALEFYADKAFDGYDVSITDYGLSTELGEIIKDGGDCARAALGEQNDE